MRLLMRPATVATANRLPTAVSWSSHPNEQPPERRGRPGRQTREREVLVVQVIDQWRYDGRWWEERELHRDYFFVEIEGGAKLELFREGDDWWAARLSD